MYWVLLVQFYYQTIQSPSLKTITNHHGSGQSYVMLSRLHTHWINPSSTHTGNAIWQFYYSTGQTIIIHRNNINHSKTYIQIKSNSTVHDYLKKVNLWKENLEMIKRKFFIKVLRTSIATALLLFALTFIVNAVTSWNASPSVTTGTYLEQNVIHLMIWNNYGTQN